MRARVSRGHTAVRSRSARARAGAPREWRGGKANTGRETSEDMVSGVYEIRLMNVKRKVLSS